MTQPIINTATFNFQTNLSDGYTINFNNGLDTINTTIQEVWDYAQGLITAGTDAGMDIEAILDDISTAASAMGTDGVTAMLAIEAAAYVMILAQFKRMEPDEFNGIISDYETDVSKHTNAPLPIEVLVVPV